MRRWNKSSAQWRTYVELTCSTGSFRSRRRESAACCLTYSSGLAFSFQLTFTDPLDTQTKEFFLNVYRKKWKWLVCRHRSIPVISPILWRFAGKKMNGAIPVASSTPPVVYNVVTLPQRTTKAFQLGNHKSYDKQLLFFLNGLRGGDKNRTNHNAYPKTLGFSRKSKPIEDNIKWNALFKTWLETCLQNVIIGFVLNEILLLSWNRRDFQSWPYLKWFCTAKYLKKKGNIFKSCIAFFIM